MAWTELKERERGTKSSRKRRLVKELKERMEDLCEILFKEDYDERDEREDDDDDDDDDFEESRMKSRRSRKY